jgi:hypothetical protein
MEMPDPILTMNLLFCIIILVLGSWIYKKKKDYVFFSIGIAFGLFGVSHFLNLLNLGKSLEIPLIVIRSIGYLLVVFAFAGVYAKYRRPE